MIKDFPNSSETLKTLYEIVEQTELTPALSKVFGSYIVESGLKILADVKSSMNEEQLASFVD